MQRYIPKTGQTLLLISVVIISIAINEAILPISIIVIIIRIGRVIAITIAMSIIVTTLIIIRGVQNAAMENTS